MVGERQKWGETAKISERTMQSGFAFPPSLGA